MKKRTKIFAALAALCLAFSSGAVASFFGSVVDAVEAAVVTTPDGAAINSVWSGLDTGKYGAQFATELRNKMASVKTKSSSYDDLKTILCSSDLDPAGSGKMLGFYDATKLNAVWDSAATWNREHVWPDSRGVGKSGPGSDPHMIRPASVKINSSRGNSMYGESGSTYDAGQYVEYYRGIAARIIFYTATYYGKASGGGSLFLTNETSVVTNAMGRISDLLKWNAKYPVQPSEIVRNEYLYANGYGRNPFIDNPEFASYIWTVDSSKGGNNSNNYVRTTAYTGDEYTYESASSSFSYSVSPSTSKSTSTSSGSTSSQTSISSETSASSSTSGNVIITPDTVNMPTSYPTTDTQYSLEGLNLTLNNVGRFLYNNVPYIQMKKSGSYLYNKSALSEISQIKITLNSGTIPTVTYGNTSSLGNTATPSQSGSVYSFNLNGANFFKIKNESSGVTRLASIEFVFGGGSSSSQTTSTTTTTTTTTSSSSSTISSGPTYVDEAILINGLPDINYGDQVVLGTVANGSGKAMSTSILNSYYLSPVGFTSNSGVISSPDSTAVWTIGKGKTEGTYSLSSSSGYLKAFASGSYKNLGYESTLTDDSSFVITASSSGYTIKSSSGIYLEYYASKNSFSAYSSPTDFYIYKLEGAAKQFAEAFLASATCTGTAPSFNPSLWQSFASSFSKLNAGQQNVLKTATANDSGTSVERCVSRYDLLVGKYGTETYADFMGRNPAHLSGSFMVPMSDSGTQVIIFALIGLGAVNAVGALYLLKRRKH
ncbi:MAG: endonuclease [Bacilli bacterium]|nr:endonuclease [Bacilli bacterium]